MRPISIVLAVAALCCNNPKRDWQASEHNHDVSGSIFVAGTQNESILYCSYYNGLFHQNYTGNLVYTDVSTDAYPACCKHFDSNSSTVRCCKEIMPCGGDMKTDQDQPLVCITTVSDYDQDIAVLAVATCPEPSETDLQLKCGRQYKLDSWWYVNVYDVLPVRDLSTRILYRNIHCALCNGISATQVKYLALRVGCDWTSNLDIATDTDLLNTIQTTNGCYFMFRESNQDVMVEDCSTSVAECNVTGKWRPFNSTILQKCLHGNRSVVRGRGTNYKNSYCLSCNAPSAPKSPPHSFKPPTFSVLLKFDGERDIGNARSSQCASGEVFSYSQKMCLRARCSLLRQLRDNACKRTVPDPDRFAYRIGLRLTPQSPLSVETGFEVVPDLGEQINTFLISVFPAVELTHIVYELVLVADVEYTETYNVTQILQANLTFYEVRFKFVNAEPHDPEEKLVEAIALEDEVAIGTFSGEQTVRFKLMLKDDLMFFQIMSSWSTRCSYRFNNDFLACSDPPGLRIWETYQTYFPESLTALPFFGQIKKENSTFLRTPITDERSLLELQKCPFIRIKRRNMVWNETRLGIEFDINNHTVPVKASEYVYEKNNSDIIWMCLETYDQLFSTGLSSSADLPRFSLVLNSNFQMIAIVLGYTGIHVPR